MIPSTCTVKGPLFTAKNVWWAVGWADEIGSVVSRRQFLTFQEALAHAREGLARGWFIDWYRWDCAPHKITSTERLTYRRI